MQNRLTLLDRVIFGKTESGATDIPRARVISAFDVNNVAAISKMRKTSDEIVAVHKRTNYEGTSFTKSPEPIELNDKFDGLSLLHWLVILKDKAAVGELLKKMPDLAKIDGSKITDRWSQESVKISPLQMALDLNEEDIAIAIVESLLKKTENIEYLEKQLASIESSNDYTAGKYGSALGKIRILINAEKVLQPIHLEIKTLNQYIEIANSNGQLQPENVGNEIDDENEILKMVEPDVNAIYKSQNERNVIYMEWMKLEPSDAEREMAVRIADTDLKIANNNLDLLQSEKDKFDSVCQSKGKVVGKIKSEIEIAKTNIGIYENRILAAQAVINILNYAKSACDDNGQVTSKVNSLVIIELNKVKDKFDFFNDKQFTVTNFNISSDAQGVIDVLNSEIKVAENSNKITAARLKELGENLRIVEGELNNAKKDSGNVAKELIDAKTQVVEKGKNLQIATTNQACVDNIISAFSNVTSYLDKRKEEWLLLHKYEQRRDSWARILRAIESIAKGEPERKDLSLKDYIKNEIKMFRGDFIFFKREEYADTLENLVKLIPDDTSLLISEKLKNTTNQQLDTIDPSRKSRADAMARSLGQKKSSQ